MKADTTMVSGGGVRLGRIDEDYPVTSSFDAARVPIVMR